jgi:hypothetical protein
MAFRYRASSRTIDDSPSKCLLVFSSFPITDYERLTINIDVLQSYV